MARKQLQKGQRIRLKVRTMNGWKGTGRVLFDYGDGVAFVKDGDPFDWYHVCNATRDQVSVIRA